MSNKSKWEIRRIEKDDRAEKLHKDHQKQHDQADEDDDEEALLEKLFSWKNPTKSTLTH